MKGRKIGIDLYLYGDEIELIAFLREYYNLEDNKQLIMKLIEKEIDTIIERTVNEIE